ncbi:MAG: outer membrane lipoprotein carrier protein LolA [Alphaproteobacteria bacterium]|nr:outer membrane lipoprotein carrier protein LolA [Alphaproteobacteria bacterium]MBL6673196.1 outer membrane lipoprotein carrier protein LolA [Alphaproteobacteria bacterium]
MHLYLKKMVAWLAAALSFIVLALPGMAHADVVSEAEDWFNGISTMQADFIQVASDGTTASGVIHLRRPHQMKIVYDLEEPLILLTTRIWIHVDRPNDKTVTSYPISETPLSLLLKKDVRLRSDEFTTSSNVQNGIVRVMLAKETGEAAGELTLEFTEKPFVLRKWTIRDAADVTTTVTLQNMRFGHQYENKMFARPDYTPTGSN